MFITPIFWSWIYSLTIFYPRALISLIKCTYTSFFNALKNTVILFWWLLLAVAPLVLLTYKHLGFVVTDNVKVSEIELIALLMLSIILLIINASVVLFIRARSDQLTLKDYFKVYFLWYMRLYMAFLLCSVFFIFCLMVLGITKLPTQSLSNIPGVQLLGMVTAFYWLDSRFRLKDIFLAFERAVNLILYNFPFFVVIAGLFYGLTQLLPVVASCFGSVSYAIFIVLFLKLFLFLGQWFLASLVYNFYKQKKHKNYAESIIE